MREKWSRLGFILAGIGSAVGLGNIWRFPYMVAEGGGGAFMIPYLLAVIIFGVPVMLIELAAGRKYRGSVMTAFKRIDPRLRYLSLLPIFVVLAILSYYLVITGFTLAYFLFSFIGYPEFRAFTGSAYPLFFFLASVAIVSAIVKFGIKGGVEKACKFLLPALFVLMLALAYKAFTMPGFAEGMAFYLTPDFSRLSDIGVWSLAFGQAFFSLSAGSAILITYGSYLRKEGRITENSAMIVLADVMIAFLAGMVIFPLVFSFGYEPNLGVGLAFIVLPGVFSSMGFGFLIGAAFFFILFAAAITSAISMLEVGVTSLIDEAKVKRGKATLACILAVTIMGLPSALSYTGFGASLMGMPFLDAADFVFGSLLLPLMGALICVAVGWFMDPKELLEEINRNSWLRAPAIMIPLVRYVIPVVLTLIFLSKLI